MNIKRVKKLIIMSCLSMALFIINSTDVFAGSNIPLPGYDTNAISQANTYDRCVYNTGNVLNEDYYRGNEYTGAVSSYYSNKEIMLIKVGSVQAGSPSIINMLNPIGGSNWTASLLNNGEAWNKGGSDQKVRYYDLNSYMLDSNGNLSCPELCFVDEDFGCLGILTPAKFQERSQLLYTEIGINLTDFSSTTCTTGLLVKATNPDNTLPDCTDEDKKEIEKEYKKMREQLRQDLIRDYNTAARQYSAVGFEGGLEYRDKAINLMNSDIRKVLDGEIVTDDDGNSHFNKTGNGALARLYAQYDCADLDYQDKLDDIINLVNQWLNNLKVFELQKAEEARDEGIIDQQQYEEIVADINQDYIEAVAYGEKLRQDFNRYMSQIDDSILTRAHGDSETCEGLLGPDVMDDIQKYMTWIRIIVPILIIVLGMVDFGKAVLSDDDKALGKATSNLIKRLIIAVFIFFVPILLTYLIDAASQVADHLTSGCDIRGW